MAYSGEGNLIEAVILGDPNKTVVPVVCDAQGRLVIDLNGSTIVVGSVDIKDSSGNNLNSTAGSLDVNVTNGVAVSNFPSSQAVTEANVDKNFGTWSYYAGTSGTVIVTGGQRVIGIGCHSTTGGSFTINGGASVPIPTNISINVEPLGNVMAPTIVFTSTDSYFVEVVS